MFKSKYLGMACALFLVWLGAFLVFHIAGFLLRALLTLAVVLVLVHLLSHRKQSQPRPPPQK